MILTHLYIRALPHGDRDRDEKCFTAGYAAPVSITKQVADPQTNQQTDEQGE